MKQVLVTAFGSYLNHDTNSSEEVLKKLPDTVLKIHLKTSYFDSFNELRTLLDENTYDYIILMGQAADRDYISFEQVAMNMIDSNNADIDGKSYQKHIIDPNQDKELETSLNYLDFKESITDFPVKLSRNCGKYVCNSLYFKVLNYLRINKMETEAVFIHLPKVENIETVLFTKNLMKYITKLIDNK